MKIAHLVPTLHPGGPEIGLVDLAAGIEAAGTGTELMVVSLAATSAGGQVTALRKRGVAVAELGVGPFDPRAVLRTARLLRERGAELVHTHLPMADVIGAAAAARNGIPAVSTLHRVGNELADRGDRLRRSARILARQRFMSRTIAISQAQLQWYRGLAGPDPSIVLEPDGVLDPGPVDPALRARRRAALDIGDTDVVVLGGAPMQRGQGYSRLLDAVEMLPDSSPVVVVLAGDGPLRPWIQARVDSSDDLTARVRIIGDPALAPDPAPHRAAALAAADIAVHCTGDAALPTFLLRAMAAGLPVVATRVGGIPEIVTAGTGRLVPLSASALSEALAGLADDAPTRAAMGAAARARYLDRYDAVGWARRLDAVYASVLAERAVPSS